MDYIGVIYWSGSGNTKLMAKAIVEAIKESGSNVDIMEVSDVTSDAACRYDKLVLGCPSMGSE